MFMPLFVNSDTDIRLTTNEGMRKMPCILPMEPMPSTTVVEPFAVVMMGLRLVSKFFKRCFMLQMCLEAPESMTKLCEKKDPKVQ